MPPKSTNNLSSTERKCVFCNLSEDNELKYGKIYEHDGIVTHYYCLLLSSNMQQRGRDEDGILGFLAVDIQKELKRGRRLFCSYCKKIGATLGCCNRKCKKVFHYPCGINNNTLHQFFGQYKSFCVVHRPKQNIDSCICSETPENPMCYICYDYVHRENIYKTLWAPCCKKNAWFHRECVQQLALSAGYFFKCPLCNNKKVFQKAMLDSGIFVPSQDASWELVPNAFQELLYRHNKCNAEDCICPHGREHTSANARWELILCRTCGSQGIHMGCGNLKWINPVWDCDECSAILNKNTSYYNKSRNRSINMQSEASPIFNESTKDFSGESSDSDVSVGVESPITAEINLSNEKPIVLRPGPRSAKLKQLQRHVKTSVVERSICGTSLEELKDILNEQQANYSIPNEIQLPNSIEPISSLNSTDSKKPENIASTVTAPSQLINDIILIDSDDEIDETIKSTKPSSITDQQTVQKDITNCNKSYMDIKISKVVSLSPEVFASASETPVLSTCPKEILSNVPLSDPSTYLLKRKADSSDVVSIIVQHINDSIDSPNTPLKRQKMDDFYHFPVATTPISAESRSVLRGVTGSSYQSGINLSQAAIVTVNGKNYVLPLDATKLNEALKNNDKNSDQSNSEGNAGTNCTEFMYESDANSDTNSTDASEYTRGRRCDDYGATKVKHINDKACTSNDITSRSYRYRLMRKRVRLCDLKFYIYPNDTVMVTYRDKLQMNIALESKRERKTVNNCSFYSIESNSKGPARVRGSNVQRHNIKTSKTSCHHDINNESIILSKCDKASDTEDSHVQFKDSTHSLANGDINNLCKYQGKKAAKENHVPDMCEQLINVNTEKLSSTEYTEQFWGDKHSENIDINSRKYVNPINVTSNPGTSRDELRELSHSNVNQRYFVTTSNIYAKGNRKLINFGQKCLSYFDQNIHCRVSIDLNRIRSIFHKIPNFMSKKNKLTKHSSLDDLKLYSTLTTINDNLSFGSLRRSKSDSNILSTHKNDSSNIFHHHFPEMNSADLQKHRIHRKKKEMINIIA